MWVRVWWDAHAQRPTDLSLVARGAACWCRGWSPWHSAVMRRRRKRPWRVARRLWPSIARRLVSTKPLRLRTGTNILPGMRFWDVDLC